MTTLFIARRDIHRARQTQAQLEASRELQMLGVASSCFRVRAALAQLDPDVLLIELRLEDGAALPLVRELRHAHQRRGERPRVMVVAADAADPLLFTTMVAGADAYLLESDLATAEAAIQRMARGEAAMAAPIAAQVLRFFREPVEAPKGAPVPNDRALDWQTHGANPMQLSPGERRMLQLLAAGARSAAVAQRMALSMEAVGRRIGNVYRKLSWDVRSGALALLAA